MDVNFGSEGYERGELSELARRPLKLKQGRATERAVRDLITINYIALRLESTPP